MEKGIIEKLRTDLSARFGHTIETPTDFNRLMLDIERVAGERVSLSTLKRYFGYVPTMGETSTNTLSVLTRYLGYKGWADYRERISGDSDFLSGRTLRCSEIEVGGRVRLAWLPDRRCVVRCTEKGRFVVESVENARLREGDTFSALLFSLKSPAYFTDVCHEGEPRGTGRDYVAGFRSGITEIEMV